MANENGKNEQKTSASEQSPGLVITTLQQSSSSESFVDAAGSSNHATGSTGMGSPRKRTYDEIHSEGEENESDTSDSDHNGSSYTRFEAMSEESHEEWVLPDGMKEYIIRYFHEYIPEKTLKDSIMYSNPIPTNFTMSLELDNFIKDLLHERGRNKELSFDKILKTIQDKSMQIFGPLSKMWMAMETAVKSKKAKVDVDLDHLLELTQQTLILSGQTFNCLSYQRRLLTLQPILKDSKAKNALKEKASSLTDESYLFGSKFEEGLTKSLKSKKKCGELLKESRSYDDRGYRQPFQRRPPSYQQKRTDGGRYTYVRNQGRGQYQNQGKQTTSFSKNYSRIDTDEKSASAPGNSKLIFRNRDSKSSFGRKTPIFFSKLEASNTGSANPGHCPRLQNTLYRGSSMSKQAAKSDCDGSNTVTISGPRSPGNAKERGCTKSAPCTRPVFKSVISSGQKGWREEACDKSQSLELAHPISTLQDGRTPSLKGSLAREGLSMQDRPEGCLFLCSNKCSVTEVSEVSVERKFIRIPVSLFWTGASTSYFHEIIKNSDSHFEANKHQSNYFSRRHAVHGTHRGRIGPSQGHNYIPIATPRLCDKPEEIRINTSSSDRISGYFSQLNNNDNFTSSGKNSQNSFDSGSIFRSTECFDFTVIKTDREAKFCCTSSCTGQAEPKIFATATSLGTTQESIIQCNDTIKRKLHSGVDLVEGKLESLQWEVSTGDSTRLSDSNRCIENRLGCSLSRDIHRGSLVYAGSGTPYKCAGTDSCKVISSDLHQGKTYKIYPFSDRQHQCTKLSSEDGRYSKSGPAGTFQGNMGVSIFPSDHDYCGVVTQSFKSHCRLRVSQPPRHKRVEVGPPGIQNDNASHGFTKHRPVCIATVTSASFLHVMEARSNQQGNGCVSSTLVPSFRLRFSTIQFSESSACESKTRTCEINNCNSSLADTALVCDAFANVNKKSTNATATIKSFAGSPRSPTSIDSAETSSLNGMAGFRESLAAEGLSEDASMLISNSRRTDTLSRYQSSWRKWASWCCRRKIDPYRCALSYVINFLAELFKQGMEYYTVNSHRSAISAYHEYIDGKPVGQHPLVCSALKGVFNLRPPQPKYVFIWDVEVVLKFMNTLPENEMLTQKLLTLKAATLMSLTAASRCSEISIIIHYQK